MYRLVVRYWKDLGIVSRPIERRFAWKGKLRQTVLCESCDLEVLAKSWQSKWVFTYYRWRADAEYQVQTQVGGEWKEVESQITSMVMRTPLFERRVGELIYD